MFACLRTCACEKRDPCLLKFANGCLTFLCNEMPLFLYLFSIPLTLSLCLLVLAAVLLRSRTCLALINVPGIRLALHLSFPLPSLLQLHPTFYPCHPRTHNASRLQLQLVPGPSRICTHARMHTHTHTAEAFRSRSFVFNPAQLVPFFTSAALSVMMDVFDNN